MKILIAKIKSVLAVTVILALLISVTASLLANDVPAAAQDDEDKEEALPEVESAITFSLSSEELPIEGYTHPEEYGAACDFEWYGNGVWSDKSQYTSNENFIDYSQFANYGDTSDYTVYFRLYNPSGVLKWSSNTTDTLSGGYYIKWTVTLIPPTGGWEPGDWQFCSDVHPALCPDLAEMCCINNVAGLGVPDIYLDKTSLNFAFTETGAAIAQPAPAAVAAESGTPGALCEACSGMGRQSTVAEQELLKATRQAIEERGIQWEADITAVSGLSLEAKKRLCGLSPGQLPEDIETVTASLGTTPPTFDWRDKDGIDWMTSVKEQICSTCWCFGTLGSLEAVINIDYNDPNIDMDLSEQRIISCCPNITPRCGGIEDITGVYDCLKLHGGTPNEACFPYGCPAAGCPESGIPCDVTTDWAEKAWQVTSYAKVTPNTTEAYKEALIEYGPLGVSMRANDDWFFYTGGIYEPVLESEEWAETFPYGQANHWVTLVGYDDAGGYWIVKNSWSEDWGEQGYGKILYGDIEKYDEAIAIVSLTGPDNGKAVTVYNEGNASLNVTDVTISYGGGEPTGWLDAERKSFTLSPHRSEGITAWVDTTGLSFGEYHATLNIYSNDPDESPAMVAVTLEIGINTPPEVSNVTAAQSSGIVNITYNVSDTEQSEVTISFEYWDGASWQACVTTTGDDMQSTGTGKSGTWNAKIDFDEHYMTNCKIKVTADDKQTKNNTGTGESNDFALDTKDPTDYGCHTPTNGATEVSVTPDLICLTASDDSPPISYYFQLAENDTFSQGLQESGWQSSTTWAPSTLNSGTQYFWRVKAKDNYANDTEYSSTFNFTTESVTNTPPVLCDGEVSPDSGYTTTDFTYLVTYSDAENHPPSSPTVSIDGCPPQDMAEVDPGDEDYIDGKVYQYTTSLTKGNHTFQFAASDGIDDATGDTGVHEGPTVENRPPTAPEVDVTPDLPLTSDDLLCAVTSPSTDADDDAITYTYEWYKNGDLQPAETTTTTELIDNVSSDLTARGQIWRCEVTPNDGDEDGPSAEDEVAILGVPIVEITWPEDGYITNVDSLTIEGTRDALPAVTDAPVTRDGLELGTATVVDSNFTYSVPLMEGSNTIEVSATNIAGTGSDDIFVILDREPPEIYGLSDDTTPTKSKTWTWFSSEAATYRYAIDQDPGGAPTSDYGDNTMATQDFGDGTYYIHVQAKDLAGNESAVYTASAILDNTAPTAIITGAPSDTVNYATANITISGQDVVYYKYSLDDPNDYGGQTPVDTNIILSGLEEGQHTLYVIGRDTAGNWQSRELVTSPTTATWTVDTIAPEVNITLPEDKLITNKPSQTVAGTITDATAITKATLILNEGEPQELTLHSDFSHEIELEEGENTILVSGTDAAENEGTDNITVTLDTTPPIISILSPANDSITSNAAQTVTGTIDDPTIISATLTLNDDEPVTVAVVGGFFSQAITLAVASATVNTIVVSANDTAGNTGSSSIVIMYNDKSPVVIITSPSSGQTTGTDSLSVTGTISPVTANATLTLNGSEEIALTLDKKGRFGQGITLSPGTNTIEVIATDTDGNTGSSGILAITLDTTAPTVVITSPGEGALLGITDITVTGTIDDLSVTSATVTLNGEGSEIEVSAGVFSHDVTLRSASATTNTILVSAEDAYGNRGTSGNMVVDVDVDRPVVTVARPSNDLVTNKATLAVSGKIDDPAIGKVTLTVNGNSETVPVSGLEFGTAIPLSEGTNTIVVTATDNAENTGSSGVITVTLDTTPPTISLTLPADGLVVNTDEVRLAGTVDDPLVNNVTLTVNDGESQIIPVQAGSFRRTVSLPPKGNNYTIGVSATDRLGNPSPPVTRTVTLNTEAPKVTVTWPANGYRTNDNSLEVIADVASDEDIESVEMSFNGGPRQPMTEVVSYAANVTLVAGDNTIEIFATDDIGNEGSSGVYLVNLDTAGPPLTIGLSNPTNSILVSVKSEEPLQRPLSVSVNGTTTGGMPVTATVGMALTDVNTWTGTYPKTGVLVEGRYAVSIAGTDLAGNKTTDTATFCKNMVSITVGETEMVGTDTTTVQINTTDNVTDASISVTQHIENPAENADIGEVEAGVFVEIFASSELRDSIEQVRIEVSYDPEEITAKGIKESSLKLYLWNLQTGQWVEVDPGGVDMEHHIIWGVVDHLSKYGSFGTATVPNGGRDGRRGGGGGGGGGGALAPGTTYVAGIITHEGRFTVGVIAVSDDELCKLTIPKDTVCLKANGVAPYELTMVRSEEPPAAPDHSSFIGLVYDFGPSGLTFDPPATLTFIYKPDDIPEGVNEEKLVIAYWDTDAGEWFVLEGSIADPVAHTISAPISHFTNFAVLAYTHPAVFTVSDLAISPIEVNIGERVIISVTVTNDGNLTGSYEVVLEVDNIIIDTEEITLAGGASQEVTFTVSKDVAGTCTVNVNGRSGTLKVISPTPPSPPPAPPVEPPAPPAESPAAPLESPAPPLELPVPTPPAPPPAPIPAINWGLIAGAIAAVIVIGGLSAYLLWWRRRTA